MNSIEHEMDKISKYKTNWYALVVCICSDKKISVAQSCSTMGMKMKDEREHKKHSNLNNINRGRKRAIFDLEVVKEAFERIKVIKNVAKELKVSETTLRKFMVKSGLITIKPKISDSYDLKEISKLLKEGNNLMQISNKTGYGYYSFYKYMQENRIKGVVNY